MLDQPSSPRKRGFYEASEDSRDSVESFASSSAGSSPAYSRTAGGASDGWVSDAEDAFSPLSLLTTYGSGSPVAAATGGSASPSKPKRARSASFEAILKGLPDEGLGGSLDQASAAAAPSGFWGADESTRNGYVFPPTADPSQARTPTGSPTAMPLHPGHAAKVKSNLVESAEKPNFLKPLSSAERKVLKSAGHGAAIIRVNSELSFA